MALLNTVVLLLLAGMVVGPPTEGVRDHTHEDFKNEKPSPLTSEQRLYLEQVKAAASAKSSPGVPNRSLVSDKIRILNSGFDSFIKLTNGDTEREKLKPGLVDKLNEIHNTPNLKAICTEKFNEEKYIFEKSEITENDIKSLTEVQRVLKENGCVENPFED